MITIRGFCRKHRACKPGTEWALQNCTDMKQVWDTARPDWLVWIATRNGVLTDSELLLFTTFTLSLKSDLIKDKRISGAIEDAEWYARSGLRNAYHFYKSVFKAEVACQELFQELIKANLCILSDERKQKDRELAASKEVVDALSKRPVEAARFAAWYTIAVKGKFTTQAEWLRKNTKPRF